MANRASLIKEGPERNFAMQERVESGGIVHRNRSLLHLHRPIQRWLTDNFKSQTPRARAIPSHISSLEFQPPSVNRIIYCALSDLSGCAAAAKICPLGIETRHRRFFSPQLSHFRDSFKFMRNAFI